MQKIKLILLLLMVLGVIFLQNEWSVHKVQTSKDLVTNHDEYWLLSNTLSGDQGPWKTMRGNPMHCQVFVSIPEEPLTIFCQVVHPPPRLG
jgi:hypothetical protein